MLAVRIATALAALALLAACSGDKHPAKATAARTAPRSACQYTVYWVMTVSKSL